jgi:hypothetical protein
MVRHGRIDLLEGEGFAERRTKRGILDDTT